MYRGGTSAQIAREIKGYQLDILGISECRWTGAEKTRVASAQTVIYSGDEELYKGGVAIMISHSAVKLLIEWTPISYRIITAQVYTRYRRVTIILVYAPHDKKKEEEQFYTKSYNVQETLDECNKNDILIVGDFNAKVGNDNMGYERTMNIHELGTHNENGENLCDFCQTNGLVITGTLCLH